jgi:Endonuclease NucS C-terminal domain
MDPPANIRGKLQMASISEEQKEQVKALLQAGQLDRDEIASKIGVSPGTVSAIKAHITMGTYGGSAVSKTETDELIEAAEATFGLERDLQLALRSNIQQLESGLQIIDDGKERITDAGRIDITARDTNNLTVVIELKAGTAAPEALTQLLERLTKPQKPDPRRHRSVDGPWLPRCFRMRFGILSNRSCRFHPVDQKADGRASRTARV